MSRPDQTNITQLEELRRLCARCSLRNLCLPAGLSGPQVDALERHVQKRHPIKGGDHLIHAGQPSRAIYVVRNGSFKSYELLENGDTQIVGLHLPGELFGLDALAADHHRLSAEALETSTICALPLDDFHRTSREVPDVTRRIMTTVSRELIGAAETHSLLARRSALERVALFLHRYCQRLHRAERNARSFELALSRQELANYLGLQLETVSRAFSRLRDAGVINAERRLVEVVSSDGLARAAGIQDEPDSCRNA